MHGLRVGLSVLATVTALTGCETGKLTGGNAAAGPRKADTAGAPGGGGPAGGAPGSGTDANNGGSGVHLAVGGQKGIPGISAPGGLGGSPGPTSAAGSGTGGPPVVTPVVGTTCSSADPSIAYVDPHTCIVTGLKPGTTVATIHGPGGTSQTVPVVVGPPGSDVGSAGSNGAGGGNSGPAFGSGSASGTGTDGLTSAEAALVAAIPGIETIQVGVNYEDSDRPSNWDWNDAVLCFNGHFKIDNTNVVSIANQQVTATTSSISGCSHVMRIQVVHADGTKEADQSVDSATGNVVPMTFRVGDHLETFMTSAGHETCHPGVEVNQHNSDFGRANTQIKTACNTTGN